MAAIKYIILSSFLCFGQTKADLYKEKEDFQYSRSSSDDGDQSGFYAAQRGNMGGNFEKSHNMDNWAQTQLKSLSNQVGNQLGINGDMLHGGGSRLATYGHLHGSASTSGGTASKGQTLGHEAFTHDLDQNAMTRNYERSSGSQQRAYSQHNLDKTFNHEDNYGQATRNQLHSDFNNNDQNIQYRSDTEQRFSRPVYPIRIIDRPTLVNPVVSKIYRNDYDISQSNSESQNVGRALYDSTNSGYNYNGQTIRNNDKLINVAVKPKEFHSSSSYKYEKEWETNSQTGKSVTPLNVKVSDKPYLNNNDESLQMQDNYNTANLISNTAGTKTINTKLVHDNSLRDRSYFDKEVQNIDQTSNTAQSTSQINSNSQYIGNQYDSTNSGHYYDSNDNLKQNSDHLLNNAYRPKVHHSSSSYKYEKEWESHGQPQADKSNLVMVPLSRDSNSQYVNNLESLQRNQINSKTIGKNSFSSADLLSKTDISEDSNRFDANKDYANMNLFTSQPLYKQSSYSYRKSWENHGSSVAKPNAMSINPTYDHDRLETFGENTLNEEGNSNKFQGKHIFTANAHDFSHNMQKLHSDLEQSLSKSLDNICDTSCNDRKNSYQANYAYSAQKSYNSESASRKKRSYNNIPHLEYPTLDSREELQTDNIEQKTENLDQKMDHFDYDQQIENDFTDQQSEDLGQQTLDYDSNKKITGQDNLYYQGYDNIDNKYDDQRKKEESFYGQEVENLDQNIEEIGQEIEQKLSEYGQKPQETSQDQLDYEQINESFDQTPMSQNNEQNVENLSGGMFHITRYPYQPNSNLNEDKIPEVAQQQLPIQKVSINPYNSNFIDRHNEFNIIPTEKYITSYSSGVGKSNDIDYSNMNIYSNYYRQHEQTESDIGFIPNYLHRQDNPLPINVQSNFFHKKNEQIDNYHDISSHTFDFYKKNNKTEESAVVPENESNFTISLNDNGLSDSLSKYDDHEFNVHFSGENPINSAVGESKDLPKYEDKKDLLFKAPVNHTNNNKINNIIESIMKNIANQKNNNGGIGVQNGEICKSISSPYKERTTEIVNTAEISEKEIITTNINQSSLEQIFPNYIKNLSIIQSAELPENIISTTTIRNIKKTIEPVLTSTIDAFRNNVNDYKPQENILNHKLIENFDTKIPDTLSWHDNVSQTVSLEEISSQQQIEDQSQLFSNDKHEIETQLPEVNFKENIDLYERFEGKKPQNMNEYRENFENPDNQEKQIIENQEAINNLKFDKIQTETLKVTNGKIDNNEYRSYTDGNILNIPINESDLQQSVAETDTLIGRPKDEPFNIKSVIKEPTIEEKIITPAKFGSYNFEDVQFVEPYTTTTTEKPGFWKKIGNTFTGAKNTVKSWFS